MSEPLKIAEDLKEAYGHAIAARSGFVITLIERVSAAEAALADAEEENARLRADLQQGEMQEHFQQDKYGFRILTKEGFNALIAARSKAPDGAQEAEGK